MPLEGKQPPWRFRSVTVIECGLAPLEFLHVSSVGFLCGRSAATTATTEPATATAWKGKKPHCQLQSIWKYETPPDGRIARSASVR